MESRLKCKKEACNTAEKKPNCKREIRLFYIIHSDIYSIFGLLANIILKQINAVNKISTCHFRKYLNQHRKLIPQFDSGTSHMGISQQLFQHLQVTTSIRAVLLSPYLYAPCSQGSVVSKNCSSVKVVNWMQDLI